MKKTILFTALCLLCSFEIYADNLQEQQAEQGPVSTEVSAQNNEAKSSNPMDCNYSISEETTVIEPNIVKTWTKHATQKSFDFSAQTLDKQMDELKACYTTQGWKGFNEALEQSGNLNAIKSQNLTVSSQVDGDLILSPAKENQWKVSVPLEVVYQNDKQKLTQLLSVDVLVGRKSSGDLGILQIIATPRVAGESEATSHQDNS